MNMGTMIVDASLFSALLVNGSGRPRRLAGSLVGWSADWLTGSGDTTETETSGDEMGTGATTNRCISSLMRT